MLIDNSSIQISLIIALLPSLCDYSDRLLGSNFRSDEIIVEAALKVINADPNRRQKPIVAVSSEKGNIYGFAFNGLDEEAQFIVDRIKDITKSDIAPDLGDIAVISRARYRADGIIQALTEHRIPWFDRVRLDYQDSWETALALASIALARRPAASQPLNWVMTAIEEGGLAYYLGDEDALEIATGFRDQLKADPDRIQSQEKLLELVLAITHATIDRVSRNESEAVQRKMNLGKMMDCVRKETKERGLELEIVVERFMGHNAVQLISGHNAKGNEFHTIFFAGLEDGIIPDYRTCQKLDELAEERRIFYVCLTRAKKTAYLTYVKRKNIKNKIINCAPSRFLAQIPKDYFTATNFV